MEIEMSWEDEKLLEEQVIGKEERFYFFVISLRHDWLKLT